MPHQTGSLVSAVCLIRQAVWFRQCASSDRQSGFVPHHRQSGFGSVPHQTGSLVSAVCLIRQAVWFRQCASSDRQSGFGSVPHQTGSLVSCLITQSGFGSVPHQTGSLVSAVCLIRQAVWFRQCASSDRQSGFGSVPHQTGSLVSACLIDRQSGFGSVPHQTGSLVSAVCLIRQAVWFRQCASSDRQSGFGSVPHQTGCLVSAWFASEQGSGSAETFTFGMVRLRTRVWLRRDFYWWGACANVFAHGVERALLGACANACAARMCVLVCQARRFANVCARARARMCVLVC